LRAGVDLVADEDVGPTVSTRDVPAVSASACGSTPSAVPLAAIAGSAAKPNAIDSPTAAIPLKMLIALFALRPPGSLRPGIAASAIAQNIAQCLV